SQVFFEYSQSDGSYNMDVPTGDYILFFDNGFEWEEHANVVPAFYPGVSKSSDATPVSAPAGDSLLVNQNMEYLASLNGQVTDFDSGLPVGGIHVAIENIDPLVDRQAAAWACTDENGDYQIDGIWPGDSLVTAIGTCGAYHYVVPFTTTLPIAAGGNANLNISLEQADAERPYTVQSRYFENDFSPFAFGGAILDWDVLPILTALYSPLAQLNNQGEWISDLLVSIPTVDNGGAAVIDDQLYVTYTLKSDLFWSNGDALTSADIRFTWETLTRPHPRVDEPWQIDYTQIFQIESIITPDIQTAVVTYKPHYISPGYLAVIPYLLPEESLSGQNPVDTVRFSEFAHYPVGNGPYMVVDWVPGSHIDMIANPNYVKRGDGLPLIPELRFLLTNFDFNSLLEGAADVALQARFNLPGDYNSYGFAIYSHTSGGFEAIIPNDQRPFFADPFVRQALFKALDRQQYVDDNWPYYTVADTYLNPDHPLFTTTFTTYNYNLTEAAAMLDAAGWVDSNANGVRDKNGIEFEFSLLYPGWQPWRQQLCVSFQEDLASIGVDVNLIGLFDQDYYDARDDPTYDAQVVGWGWDNPLDPAAHYLFHSSSARTPYNSYRGSFFSGNWMDAAQDSLLESLERELDIDSMKDKYAQHLDLWTQQLPIFPTRHSNLIHIADPTLLNFKPGGPAHATWNIEEWQVPPNPYDLSVRKSLTADSPAPQPGEVITYSLQVRNEGYFAMNDVHLIDWNLGDLPGESQLAPILVRVQILPGVTHNTIIVNDVRVYDTSNLDLRPSNNRFIHSLTVREDVDLAINKFGVGQPAIGEHYDYFIDYANWGGAPAAGVVITDILPPEVNLISANPAPIQDDRTLTWIIPTLDGNQWGGQIELTAEITESGKVTNTALINSAEPDVNPGDNQDEHVENVNSILAPVINRPTSGVTDDTPTVSGQAPSNSTVRIYDITNLVMARRLGIPVFQTADLLGTTTASALGEFSKEFTLPEGSYILAATAEKDALVSDYSNVATIFVDHDLLIDTDTVTILADDVDMSTGCIRARRNVLAYRMLDISLQLECPVEPSAQIRVIENGISTYYIPALETNDLGGGNWGLNFHVWLGAPHSSYEIYLEWECDGVHYEELLLYILIDPDGYLYDQSLVDAGSSIEDSLILNGVVTAYVKIGDDWSLWPAHLYAQTNPQSTDDTTDDGVPEPGYYSFLTPAGSYRLQASAPGYQPYQSPVLTVITEPVHLDIGLIPIQGGSGLNQSPVNLTGSSKSADLTSAWLGEEVTIDLWLHNSGDENSDPMVISDTLPAGLAFVDGSLALTGDGLLEYLPSENLVRWSGQIAGGQSIHIQYKVQIVLTECSGCSLVIGTQVQGGAIDLISMPDLFAEFIVEARFIYLPLVLDN
ncbi:ABC transporter substrate-binding protein, partial [Chloroflexota bacterium]